MAEPITSPTEVAGPFGTPDGARASFDLVQQGFVDFEGDRSFGALTTRADDASVRVIVGALGTGKTVYMRRLSAFQAQEPSVYADHVEQSPPATSTIVLASDWFGGRLTENWKLLWGRAILRAVATHLLASRRLSDDIPDTFAQEIKTRYQRLLGEFRRPRSIYTELTNIVAAHSSGNHLLRFLNDSAWGDLEDELAEVLSDTPPMFFYLDAIDESWASAPAYWMRCQEGLFFQVMDLLRHSRLGGRLHVCIGIRDLVLSSIYRSEHGPRYRDEPHIRVLDWDRAAVKYLLMQKIAKLPAEYLMAPEGAQPMDSWLGTHWIYNEKRHRDENMLDYLLRHTRMIPRDVITLGNALCRLVLREKHRGAGEMSPKLLREIVSNCARGFGDSQLAQCAGEISAAVMPRHAVHRGFSDAYLDNQEFVDWVCGELRALIRHIGVDRMTADHVAELRNRGSEVFEKHVDVATILWHSKLLGYATGRGECRFYSLVNASSFKLPDDRDEYVLHPCLLDSVSGLRSVGRVPVHPYAWTE
jgi:hypothetical protein